MNNLNQFLEKEEISEKKGIELTEEERLIIKANLETYRKEGDWRNFSNLAMEAKIIDAQIDLKLGKKELDGIYAGLEEARDIGTWGPFVEDAMEAKILDPKKDLKLGKKELDGINAKLEEYRKKGEEWWLFSELATLRKILASKEIKTLPGGGLEVK